MKTTITIGTWWKEVKKSLDEVSKKYPEFAAESKQYQILYKAAGEGIKLDSLWNAKTAGGLLKQEMEKLTDGLPAFESSHSEASLALLIAFKKCLENYPSVKFSQLEIQGAKAFGENLDATFEKNARAAQILLKIINDQQGEFKSGSASNLSIQITNTTTTTSTLSASASASPTNTGSPRLFTTSTPEHKKHPHDEKSLRITRQSGSNRLDKTLESLEKRDAEIKATNAYLSRLNKMKEEGKDTRGDIDQQIEAAKKILENAQSLRKTTLKVIVRHETRLLVEKVIAEVKNYSQLDQTSQEKVRELLKNVFQGEHVTIYLMDIVDKPEEFQTALKSLLEISKQKITGAISCIPMMGATINLNSADKGYRFWDRTTPVTQELLEEAYFKKLNIEYRLGDELNL